MSLVAAVRTRHKDIVIGCDSLHINTGVAITGVPSRKVARKKTPPRSNVASTGSNGHLQATDAIIGTTGPTRFANIVRAYVELPEQPDDDAYDYAIRIADAICEACMKHDFNQSAEGRAKSDAHALLAYRGGLYHIGPFFSVQESIHPYHAIGAGHEGAMIALQILSNGNPAPSIETGQSWLSRVMAAAAIHSHCIRPPFSFATVRRGETPKATGATGTEYRKAAEH